MVGLGISEDRKQYSINRIEEVRSALERLQILLSSSDFTIYVAGSYARLEASEYSDIDLFFLDARKDRAREELNGDEIIREAVEIVRSLKFPDADTPSQYMKIMNLSDMTNQLGGPRDDIDNHFTSRMLLLLESAYLFDETSYKNSLSHIIKAYFKDFPKHRDDFKPIFMANDIMRYWKTLCLNYEHKRYKQNGNPAKIIKHKVKNFKLKMSRMTTCFATLASFAGHSDISEEALLELVRCTPRKRLENIGAKYPESSDVLADLFADYDWFLQLTGLPTEDLEAHFSDQEKRLEIFRRANSYGDKMYNLLRMIDPDSHIVRYLVI